MKKNIIIIFLFIYNVSLSQLVEGGRSFESVKGGTPLGKIKGNYTGNTGALYSDSKKYSYDKVHVEGSQYLFEEWKNNATIIVGNKKYIISNINFNIDKQAFMSKIEHDSVYIYNINNDDKILINGRRFQSIYNNIERKNKVYEVSYSGKDFSVLKEYYVAVIEASSNPMLNRPNRKIKQKNKFLIYTTSKEFVGLKLQKKSILALMENKNIETVKKFVDEKKLSYKKEDDIIRIFKYHDSL
jgi:hypothetical protein